MSKRTLRTICAGLLLVSLPIRAAAQDPSARIVGRYREMLQANPVQGTALDRLWKIYRERSATAELLEGYRTDGSFAGQMLYGHLLRKAGQPDAAAEAYARAATTDAKSPLPHLALAELSTAGGDSAGAAEELDKACALHAPADPSLPTTLLKLGAAWAGAGEQARAADAWERTVKLDPANVQLRVQLAQSYEAGDLPARAVPHYEFIAANGSAYERALAFRDLARVRQVLGQEDAAIAALESGIALTAPGNWLREELQTRLIRLHQRFGRTDELEKRWRSEVERNPRDLGGYLQLIALYRQLADQPREREWLERLVELAPRNLDYKERLAQLLERLGESGRAAELYDAILAARPDDVDAAFTRATIDLRQGSVREAQERIERLLAAHPDDESVRAKALDFYARHRLLDTLERHLREGATDPDGIVALAQFHFERKRDGEARATLERLVDPKAPPETQAAALQRIAGIYRERNAMPSAIDAMERAAALLPGSSAALLALGDLYLSADDPAKARETVERAYALAADDAAREDADQTLFRVFQSSAGRKPEKEPSSVESEPLLDRKGRINLFAVPLPAATDGTPEEVRAVAEYVAAMAKSAEKEKSADAWLRVARWQMWARRADLGMQAAAEALKLAPDSLPARKLVVKIAATNGLTAVAASQLRELGKLDPANAPRYRKQLADLQLATGDATEALSIFKELSEASPGDVERLSDLALAQQQVGDWNGSLATWRKAYQVGAPSQWKSVVPPLVRALDRAGRNDEAAGLLLASVDAQEDETLRLDAFRDLLGFATAHGLGDWLRDEFEARHRRRPNDYFTEIALAQILKAEGREADGFELLRVAAYSAPDPVAAFEQLSVEAEALGRIDTAIEAQKRLIALRSDESPEALENLAALQERALAIGDAFGSWKKLVARFPRDPEILRRAAAFFALWRYDAEASEALRTVRVLEPGDLLSLLRLADLAHRVGGEAEALSCYDQILRLAKPEPETGEIVVPDVPAADKPGLHKAYLLSLRSRRGVANTETLRVVHDFWSGGEDQPTTDAGFRLAAIRGSATILAGPGFEAQRGGWLEEWERNRDAPPSERLWAFYFAGDPGRTLAVLRERMEADPENPYTKQGFIWLALRTRAYAELGAWLGDGARKPQDRDLMAIALGQYLASNPGALDPQLVSTVFPPEYKLRQVTWQTAALLANAGHFREAAQLGERVFADSVSNRAVYGSELAFWYLVLGEEAEALRVLGASIAGQYGDAPDAPVFEALRRYYLLLPDADRAKFVAEYLADPAVSSEPMHSALSRVLLYGLARDGDRVVEALRDLYALHGLSYSEDYDGSATYRAWSFLLATGLQLQRWRLDGLAGALWERALQDPALARLAGKQVGDIVQEMRVRLAAIDLVTRSPVEGQARLAEFMRGNGGELAPSLAATLESAGYPEFSIGIFRQLWESDPAGLHHLRGLLNACRAANATAVGTDALIDSMEAGMLAPNPAIYRDAVLQFVDFLLARESDGDAERLLSAAGNRMPEDPMILERQARVAKQRGDVAEATRLYRRLLGILPGNNQTRLLLAGLLDEQGKIPEAITLLEQVASGPSSQTFDAPLADLYLRNGQADRAQAMVGRLMRSNQFDAMPGLAQSLAEGGHRREAQRILYAIVQRARSEGDEFLWQTKLLEVLSPKEEPDLYRRALDQLRGMADASPELQPQYFETRLRLARKHGTEADLRTELVRVWAQGAGPFAAGAALVEIDAGAGDVSALATTVGQLLAHPDFDENLLRDAGTRLAEAGRRDLAARVAGALAERMPLSADLAIAHARALGEAGDIDAATGKLEDVARRAIVDPALAGRVGEELVRLGNRDAAARAFERAVALDPFAANYGGYVHYARLLIARRDLGRARRVLRFSFRNPANADVGAIVDLLAAEGALPRADEAVAEFQLSPQNLRGFQRALAARTAP